MLVLCDEPTSDHLLARARCEEETRRETEQRKELDYVQQTEIKPVHAEFCSLADPHHRLVKMGSKRSHTSETEINISPKMICLNGHKQNIITLQQLAVLGLVSAGI